MNKKPIIIIASVLVVALCSFLFIRSKYLAKPEQKEVLAFLDHFNADIKQGFTDTLLNYFDGKQSKKQLIKLLGLLSNKTGLNGRDSALFTVNLLSGDSKVIVINNELTNALVPVTFNYHGNDIKQTTLLIKLRKISSGQFKIIQIDAHKFITDFTAYENNVRSYDVDRTITYDPATLEAFKIANKLKARYDTVVWFAHVKDKLFFYVVKGGAWEPRDTNAVAGKMGLVNPDLKEVIPPEFDLIHSINATFPGMVEVEKGNKRGFYDLDGKVIIPPVYDQILPIEDEADIALLRKGDDYYYLEKDFSISNKVDIKISDYIAKIKNINHTFDARKEALKVVTEYNSETDPGAVYIAPSYLVDLNIIESKSDFRNPYRKGNYEFIHEGYDMDAPEKLEEKPDNWFMAAIYSIKVHFLGGRGDFYEKRNLLFVDKKKNRILTQDITTDYSPDGMQTLHGTCDVNNIRTINDSLFELRSGAVMYADLYDSTKTIVGGPYYHYLVIQDNKLVEMPTRRMFNFTRYVKMDDSYLTGCYNISIGTGVKSAPKQITIDHITPEMLRYMKNEIYADYRYQFKDKRWEYVFGQLTDDMDINGNIKPKNANVDDSLTVIDKYNINFINNKLKGGKQPQTLAAAK